MSRYSYIGLLLILLVGAGAAYLYKTDTSAAQVAFGDTSLRLDYATTTEARELGLGGRESLPDDYGMLFVFPSDDLYGFWMQDMLVPIDLFWLDAQGQVIAVDPEIAPETYPNVFYPPEPVRYVLETAAGFAKAHRVTVGTSLYLKNLPSVTE
jgi:hypothetical protein